MDRWEAVGVAAFTLWIAWPFLDPGGFVTDYDTVAYSGPNLEATYRAWGERRLPWWEPGAFGGTAFSANLQTAPFYPLKVVFWPLGAPIAMGAMTATHLFLLAFGMRHLARRTLRLAAPAGFVAAVVMVGAGSTMVRTVRFEQISVLAWLPWLLILVDAVLVARPGRRSRTIAGCAGIVAVTILSGHPQTVHLVGVLTLVWIVGRLVDDRVRSADGPADSSDSSDSAWSAVGRVALAVALGVGICAVALVTALPLFASGVLPTEELLRQAGFGIFVLDPIRFVPTFLGDLWSPTEPLTYPTVEAPAFLGVGAIGLAVVGAAVALFSGRPPRPPLRGTAVVLVVASAVSVLLAFGPGAGVYRVAAAVVPGVGHGRVPLRWLLIVTFTIAVLAAVGASALRDHLLARPSREFRVVRAGLVALALASVAPPYGNEGSPLVTRVSWLVVVGAVALVALFAARHDTSRVRNALLLLVVGLVVVELGVPAAESYGRRLRRGESFVESANDPTSSFLAASGSRYLFVGMSDANESLTSGTRTLDGYDGGMWLTDTYVAAAQQLVDGTFAPLGRIGAQVRVPLDADTLAQLGVRYVVIDPHDQATRALGRPPTGEDGVDAARDQLVPDWVGPVLVDGSLEIWENPRFQSEALVYPGDVKMRGVPAEVERPAPGAIDVTTTGSPSAGLLVVAEQAQAGWEVSVDGVPADLVDVDGFALAVELPPGSRRVELRYRPPGLVLGAVVTMASLMAVVLLAFGRSVLPERVARSLGGRLGSTARRSVRGDARFSAGGNGRSVWPWRRRRSASQPGHRDTT